MTAAAVSEGARVTRGTFGRSLRRHLVVGSISVCTGTVLMLLTEFSSETWGMPEQKKTAGSLWQFNIATGTVALGLLVATLTYRPARVLLGRSPGPAHFPWRRTLGVWSAIAVVAHVPGGLAIHTTGWRFWTPFESLLPGIDGRPFDEFTVGYWMGLFAVLALIPLAVTSNASSLRRLGARRWQRLHRVVSWTLYCLVAFHVVALQYGEFRNRRHVALTGSIFAVAIIARLAVLRSNRRARPVGTAA
jgi:sulfoxide reductase heme-binding subunit YedZ